MSRHDLRARLVERARAELPEPGDPRQLMGDLAELGADTAETLEVVARCELAWMLLRDQRLEKHWQGQFGWFLGRNLMVFAIVALALRFTAGITLAVLDGALVGATLYYFIALALAPLRLRPQKRRRRGILQNYARDLEAYLERLEAAGGGALPVEGDAQGNVPA